MNELILTAIDTEIEKLTQIRAILTAEITIKTTARAKKRGRPAGSEKNGNLNALVSLLAPTKDGKRVMSAAGRARIVLAQKKRWAAQKKAA